VFILYWSTNYISIISLNSLHEGRFFTFLHHRYMSCYSMYPERFILKQQEFVQKTPILIFYNLWKIVLIWRSQLSYSETISSNVSLISMSYKHSCINGKNISSFGRNRTEIFKFLFVAWLSNILQILFSSRCHYFCCVLNIMVVIEEGWNIVELESTIWAISIYRKEISFSLL
jgi:hypothetical protein